MSKTVLLVSFVDYSRRDHVILTQENVENDFRFQKLQLLSDFLHQDILTVDISTFEGEEMIFTLLDLDKTCGVKDLVVYVTSFCPQHSILYKVLKLFKEYLDSLPFQNINFFLVQDLIFVERSYILNQKERSFFRNVTKTIVDVKLTNSNEIRNSWGEGDTYLREIPELAGERCQDFWSRVLSEVEFSVMMNQGNPVPRMVSIQSLYNPHMGRPLYRHPNDEEPPNLDMCPVVLELLSLVSRSTGVDGINHVLIQHYRDGRDMISAHSDKTLDIHLGTPILNLSLGCPRLMSLQRKGERESADQHNSRGTRIIGTGSNEVREKVPMVNGTCLVFGLQTNRKWWHEIPKDVSMTSHPIFGTSRISFTFRRIETFSCTLNITLPIPLPISLLLEAPNYPRFKDQHEDSAPGQRKLDGTEERENWDCGSTETTDGEEVSKISELVLRDVLVGQGSPFSSQDSAKSFIISLILFLIDQNAFSIFNNNNDDKISQQQHDHVYKAPEKEEKEAPSFTTKLPLPLPFHTTRLHSISLLSLIDLLALVVPPCLLPESRLASSPPPSSLSTFPSQDPLLTDLPSTDFPDTKPLQDVTHQSFDSPSINLESLLPFVPRIFFLRSDLILSFSHENKQSDAFDWAREYGGGFMTK